MTRTPSLPAIPQGGIMLTDGGTETEILYKAGFELPQFAMFPLLDNPDACKAMRGMWRQHLDAAAKHALPAMLTGLDYRASPDWGAKLGYSPAGLAEITMRGIAFLHEIAAEYSARIPSVVIASAIGPRGDAYGTGGTISAAEAEDYHSVQLETVKTGGADLAKAMTFNNIPEAVGFARAAKGVGITAAMTFTLSSDHRLRSGPSLREAVERTEEETGGSLAFYGINCSHPEEFAPAIEDGAWFERVRCIRPNAAKMDKISLCRLGHLEEGDAEDLARRMGDLARRFPQIDIWGGCCGTGGRHLDLIAAAVIEARRTAELA